MVGAGAAGTMAAIFAAKSGAEVVLLEGSKDGGRKILISGGGRCNILPMRVGESRFVTDSSANTLRRIVRSWPLAEQRAFFENDVGIALADEPESVKVFPASHRARDVRDGLLALAARNGASVQMNARVTDVVPESGRWRVEIAGREPMVADAVIIACGGLSVPATGSDGAGLAIARALGHEMHPTYAALTPILAAGSSFGALSGVSLTVTLTARSSERTATATGGFLFTHRGYSGPAALDVSHVLVRAQVPGAAPATLIARWTSLGDAEWTEALKPSGTRTVTGALRTELPERLAAVLLEIANVDPARSLAELRREERIRLINTLVRCELPWAGDEGYKKAEVTGGGVSLTEIDSRTMESRRHRGLYFCGEVLDAFGPIGGYNFLWAWATGRAAGTAAGSGAASRAAPPSAASSRDA
ncbi:MAG: aminoacetone oxidase family FAD-binding enzyme [Gemmatimonadota bacterium]|nr:aminoacetone oxidase family FAD-binding enzyme [Gemmatimonadota bacterium]